jgi:DNA polymerase III subunit beta
MKFIISSSLLYSHLQSISKVIASKNTLPILDNFLFKVKKNDLTIIASDLETTLITKIPLDNVEGDGNIAIESKRLLEILKEFPEQPLTFDFNTENFTVDVLSENGKFSLVGADGMEFPQIPSIKKESSSLKLNSDVILNGINKTLFATADDELRPVMNGIFIEIANDEITFVASDSHKLVRYKRTDVKTDLSSAFILPKKPASILKNILPREDNDIVLKFDEKNAYFSLKDYDLICRLIEGNYPSYSSVIPTDNPNKLIVDRLDFLNTLKRVSVFSNQASNLVKLDISGNQMTISAEDIDFSISAYERIKCQYEGEEIVIGFKSLFLRDILSVLSSAEVLLELSDPARAGLLIPKDKENESEDILMLLMPMMINV